ncbi:MAG TPA: hypothetical protein HA349_04155, partial [Methanotrichaceae archaeon]|nr:hypothetical protein [Methanotrichaceae archaeon]
MPPESTRPTQQITTENRTTAASEKGSVAIGGDASGNIIAIGDVTLPPEALDLLRPRYRPPPPPPPDVLPARNGLPPGKRLDFLANDVFTGREEDLLGLAHVLLHEPNSRGAGINQAATAATGLGGIGKSQLAVEFCYRYGRFFHGVHWIQADQDISAEVAACGASMNLPRWPADKVPEQVALTLRTWEEGGPRLVVLDNVEDPATVQEWLPKMQLARLILTSRRSEWPADMGLLIWPLGVLTLPESLTLLRKLAPRLKDVDDSDLENLAERFGCLPLALDLAGRYLHDRTDLSVEDYLAELEEAGNSLEHTSLKDWADHNPTKHATNLAATFSLSWDQLGEDEADALARQIFLTCGYCAPNTPIPKSLLANVMGTGGTSQKQKLDLALRRLLRLGLLKFTECGPSQHPLLSEFARYLDFEGAALPSLAESLSVLSYDAHETGLPERVMPLREHLKSVAKVAENAELETAGSLWNNLGCHLKEIAEYKNAEEAHRRALEFN